MFSRSLRRAGRALLAEELVELIFTESRDVRNQVDARELRVFGTLRCIEENVLAIRRPRDV